MLTGEQITLLSLAESLTKGLPLPNAKEACEALTKIHETLVELSKIKVGK